MIKFIFLLILLVTTYVYIRHHSQHPFFYIEDYNKKYNLVNLSFINLNISDYIEQNNMILLKEDALELKLILEDCYLSNIKIEIKRK